MKINKKNIAALLVLAVAGAGLPLQAGAAPVTTSIAGSHDPANDNCTAIISFVFGNFACNWTNNQAGTTSTFSVTPQGVIDAGGGAWIGPTWNGGYYAKNEPGRDQTYKSQVGDDKMPIALSGSVTISQNGDLGCSSPNDCVAGTIILEGAQWNINPGSTTRGWMRWDSLTHTLATTAFSSRTGNGLGGFDYVLGSAGAPGNLHVEGVPGATVFRDTAPGTLYVPVPPATTFTKWDCDGPANPNPAETNHSCLVGIGRSTFLDNNVGGVTTATAVNLQCASITNAGVPTLECLTGLVITNNDGINNQGTPCSATVTTNCSNTNRPLGWDNLILVLSTDGTGAVVSGQGYWTQEEVILGVGTPAQRANKNAYQAGHFTFTGEGVVAAVDDTATVQQDSSNNPINVLANDAGFTDPVTVTISVNTDHGGTATPVGSPGAKAAVRINYTPAAGFSGTETFSYTVSDGTNSKTAVVTVTVNPKVQAKAVADSATTNTDAPVAIAIAQNDPGFATPVTISLVSSPLHGAVQVSGSPGPPGGVLATYTPDPGFAGSDSFQYAIADGVASDTATVSITVTPVAVVDNQTTNSGEPVLIPVLANDLGVSVDPVVVAIAPGLGPQHGTATVLADKSVFYTPEAGFVGTDTFNYTVTDQQGSSGTAQVIVVVSSGPGSGGGAFDFTSLALLGLAALRRRLYKP